MDYSLENKSNLTSNSSNVDCSLPVAHGVALVTSNAIVGVLGTLGNLLVCLAVVTNPRLRRPSNYLLFSLAIADLIITMVCERVFVALLGKQIFLNDCATSLELVFVFISSLSSTVSVVHLAAISVDRLLAVVYPLRHKGIMESFGLKTMLSVSWIVPTTVFILGKSLQVPSAVKLLFNLAVFTLCYAVVFVSYLAIVIYLVKQNKKRKQMTTSFSTLNARLEMWVSFTLANVNIVFTACWFPLFIVFAVSAYNPLVKLYGFAHMWIRTLALSNSAMNFLIYGSRIRHFGDTYVEIFQKVFNYAGMKSRQEMGVRRVHAQEENWPAPRNNYETRL